MVFVDTYLFFLDRGYDFQGDKELLYAALGKGICQTLYF